jgi:hypothetical protein
MRNAELLATKAQPWPPSASLAWEYAMSGWVVEVTLADDPTDRRYFAVGEGDAKKAEEVVLRYPGIMVEDRRNARRALSMDEIAILGVRTDGVRPYRSSLQSSRNT